MLDILSTRAVCVPQQGETDPTVRDPRDFSEADYMPILAARVGISARTSSSPREIADSIS